MEQDSSLFDASSILIAVREFGEKAIEILSEGFTVSLAFYEVGNAIWKESFLFERIAEGEAVEILRAVFAIIERMNVIDLSRNEDLGVEALVLAGRFNLTFYDAVYLAAAQKHGNILVTEDERLRKAAEKVETATKRVLEIRE